MTVQVRCIRPFSQYEAGDTEEVPDGAAFDPFHWEPTPERKEKILAALDDNGPHVPFPIEDPPADPEPEPATPPVPQLPYPAKEM
jgi:hypothetical protein